MSTTLLVGTQQQELDGVRLRVDRKNTMPDPDGVVVFVAAEQATHASLGCCKDCSVQVIAVVTGPVVIGEVESELCAVEVDQLHYGRGILGQPSDRAPASAAQTVT